MEDTVPGSVPERHPVLALLLDSALRVSGPTLASDLRQALRGLGRKQRRIRATGVDVPVVPAFGADEGLAILEAAARSMHQSLFAGQTNLRSVRWSPRIFRVAGRAFLARGDIELSWRLYCEVGLLAFGPIVAHELVHLWLHHRRRPSGHGAEFALKSRELGLPEMHHHLRIESGGHRYRCPGCGRQYLRAARLARTRACATCCDRHAQGRFDGRFALEWLGRDEPRHGLYPPPGLTDC
jgi:predicted SprT family Zn-dependent metalloprotease